MKSVSLNIAFFVGSDVTSHLILNETINLLIKNGHKPFIFFIPQNQNPNTPPELKELFFYERRFLNEYSYPYLDSKNLAVRSTKLRSIKQLKEIYKDQLYIQIVENINNQKFIEFLKKNFVTAGISLRCYQKFSQQLIDYFLSSPRKHQPFFVNLHPGLLPQYRGVTTYSRAMQNRDAYAGFTLHFINKYWDAGPIISKDPQPLNYSLSVVENMCLHANSGSMMLTSTLEKLSSGEPIKSKKQLKSKAVYYTHATKTDFIDFKKKKIKLVRPKEIMRLILEKYLSLEEKDAKAIMQLTQISL